MNPDRDKVLQVLSKLKRLAARGVAGEATVAGAKLRGMMERHCIRLDEIPDEQAVAGGTIEMRPTRLPDKDLVKLFSQIIWAVTGRNGVYHLSRASRRRCYVEVTEAELAEIEFMLDLLAPALREAMDLAYRAFIHVQELFPPNAGQKDLPRDEHRKLARAMSAIDKVAKVRRLEHENNKLKGTP